jgi:hypothetical protein
LILEIKVEKSKFVLGKYFMKIYFFSFISIVGCSILFFFFFFLILNITR